MSEAIIIAVIGAISPVLVAIISIISNSLVVKTKVEQLQDELSKYESEYEKEIRRIPLLERWVIEDGRLINSLISRVDKLEDKDNE